MEKAVSLDPLLHASPVIQIHALFAFLALLLGAVQLFRKKGDTAISLVVMRWRSTPGGKAFVLSR